MHTLKELRKYLKKADSFVVAIQVDLDTAGFTYQKWGGTQFCKKGDWLVDNGGDVYTVDGETFARTYRRKSAGIYFKVTPVWAAQAQKDGSIRTKEGITHYSAGDMLVYNDEEGVDGYAMSAQSFQEMYEPFPAS